MVNTITPDLLDACVELLRSVPLPAHDLVVQHTVTRRDGTALAHHQVFAAGRLDSWTLGAAPRPHLNLTQDVETRASAFGSALPARETPLSLAILEDRHPEPAGHVALAPLDELAIPARDAPFPEIESADASAWFWLTDGPFGDIGFGLSFRAGRPCPWETDEDEDPADKADVVASMTYDAYLAYRCGHLSVVDALDGRKPSGAWPHLMLVAGLLDGPEYQAARQSVSPQIETLTAWMRFASIASADGYRSTLAQLEPGA